MKSNELNNLYEKYGNMSPDNFGNAFQNDLNRGLASIQEITNKEDAQKFLKLLALLREAGTGSLEAIGEYALDRITGAFAGGDEGVYSADTNLMNARFIYELVQNVDDCKFKSVNDCKLNIQFDIDKDLIRLEYNELGFKPRDVLAITGLGDSTKNHSKAKNLDNEKNLDQSDLQEIGEKGIGFKSVFGLAKSATIQSQYFSFRIDRRNFFLPIIGDYTNFSFSENTILELQLDEGLVSELYFFLKSKYDDVEAIVNENPILFLNKLTEIKYSKSETEYFGFRVSRSYVKGDYSRENTTIEFISSERRKNKKIEAYRFTHNIEFSIDECRARYGPQENTTRKHKIVVIAPKRADMIFKGRIYSFFATSEEINAPFIIHAPFKLNSGRTRIDSQSQSRIKKNRWFIRTEKETVDMIRFVYEELARLQGNKIYHYIPKYSLVNYDCAISCEELKTDNIITWNIFEDVEGNHLPASEVCCIDFDGDKERLRLIHRILGIKKNLLNIDSNELKFYRDFNIELVGGIKKALLKSALTSKDYVSDCLEIIGDYDPGVSMRTFISARLHFSVEQLIAFSNYDKLCSWINRSNFEYVKNNSSGAEIVAASFGKKKDISSIISFCNEYDTAIDIGFKQYVNGVDYYEVDFKNAIFTYNAVFGQENILDCFAKAYHFLEPNDRYFHPFLKIEAVSEEINNLCESGGDISDSKFLELLSYHRNHQKQVLGNQYKSILDLIEKSGTETSRFFPELLQNIDDCEYEEKPSVSIRSEGIDGGTYRISVEYNETGFSRDQVRAITAIGDSTKKRLLSNKTGEKGIGFKSVFALCSSVSIESGSFCFELNSDAPTVPKKIKKNAYHNGTKMVFVLKPREAKTVVNLLLDEQKLLKNCLCLKQVHNLEINQKKISIEDRDNRRFFRINEKTHEFYKHSYNVRIDNLDALNQRKLSRDVQTNQTIDYLIPINPKEYGKEYHVYSTFPTQEIVHIPVIINMPLELDTARERIQDTEWNKEIINRMIGGLLGLYDRIKLIFKEKLPLFFPENGVVLSHKFGRSSTIISEIATRKFFKLALKNEYISLNKGVFSHDFEYYLFKEYGKYIEGNVPAILLEKNEQGFEKLRSIYGNTLKERDCVEIYRTVDSLFNKTKEQEIQLLDQKEFRDSLYGFLSEPSIRTNKQLTLLKKWKIIPVKNRKRTEYYCYSEDIYAPANEAINSEKYKILNSQIMSVETFNRIFDKINNNYRPISTFSKDVIVSEFFQEICAALNIEKKPYRAKRVLELYTSEKDLFTETYHSRKDFPVNKLVFKTRTGEYSSVEECYTCDDKQSQGCLDRIIVEDDYLGLANLTDVPRLSDISSYSQIPFEIGRKELSEINRNKNLFKRQAIIDSLYLYEGKSKTLRDGVGFFELFDITSRGIRTSKEQNKITVTITEKLLQQYATLINEISVNDVPINFIIEAGLSNFEKDNILSEIEGELQLRKETSKLNLVKAMLLNCFYAEFHKKEPCCIRTQSKNLLLIDSKITSDYEIIETLKAYFLKYFNIEITINRNIRLYNRRGFENISTIMSTEKDVDSILPMMDGLNLTNVEEVKDFLCKPQTIKGVTFGGYAKTCPLCDARIDTELTGMRIYKTKCNDVIVPLISCTNCYENLRYSSSIRIDMNKLKEGMLDLECQINGYDWNISDKVIRLGHRALIKKMNWR